MTYQTSSYPRYKDLSGDLTIPETVTDNGTTYSVTSIGNDAFYGCSGLTSVTIPNSVTTIGSDAFYYCNEQSRLVVTTQLGLVPKGL